MTDKTNPRRALSAIENLETSEGWAIMRDVMQAEIWAAMAKMCSPTMTNADHINFQRGAIYSAIKLLEMPDRLKMQYENDVIFTESSAKAEQEKDQ